MPMMSFVMAINGPVAIAGSIFSLSRVIGTNVPKIEANMTTANKLMIQNRSRLPWRQSG